MGRLGGQHFNVVVFLDVIKGIPLKLYILLAQIEVLLSGLAVPTVGVNAFETAKGLIDKMVLVK